LISLQHMPEKMAAGYIAEMCRVLSPGGVAYLQMSTYLSVRDSRSLAKLARDESGLSVDSKSFSASHENGYLLLPAFKNTWPSGASSNAHSGRVARCLAAQAFREPCLDLRKTKWGA
jgi:hypothetical protein